METHPQRLLLNGDEAIAWAARDNGFAMGVGYPGTPSTEILEAFGALGGHAQWSPNEKVALEVGLGAAFARARVLVTMKHVGLNVAADPLFTVAYTGVDGALVIVVADDPGMASSQNEQDSRRYAVAAGVPMLEPADSQQAYDCLARAVEISERWQIPVLLRITTRVSHSKTIVARRSFAPPPAPAYERKIPQRVMVPGHARPAHRRLREKLEAIRAWAEEDGNGTRLHAPVEGRDAGTRGIIASGIGAVLAREAAPDAPVLQVFMAHPLPEQAVRRFAAAHARTYIVEEGDPVLWEGCVLAGAAPVRNPPVYRFGEMSVTRVARLLAGETAPETPPPPGKPPQLCVGCPHRTAFEILRDRQAIVSGDIGCYTLGVMPPYQAMDTTVCMGASISAGLGLRHVLPEAEARRVVSVIGDSTFMHSGLTGIAEMIYNPPPTGHVVLILDNGTTAMTGMQEHPATGRDLLHGPANRVSIEATVKAMGVPNVIVLDHVANPQALGETLDRAGREGGLWVIVARRPCILAAAKIKQYDAANAGAKA
jgi:indolepyruvate ferredoxin oxidoreductase alpha subunit